MQELLPSLSFIVNSCNSVFEEENIDALVKMNYASLDIFALTLQEQSFVSFFSLLVFSQIHCLVCVPYVWSAMVEWFRLPYLRSDEPRRRGSNPQCDVRRGRWKLKKRNKGKKKIVYTP